MPGSFFAEALLDQGFAARSGRSARPISRVYQLTEAGSAALQDWLARDQPVSVSRDSFLVQLYFARLLSREQMMVEWLDACIAAVQALPKTVIPAS